MITTAIEAALLAGAEILDVYASPIEATEKADQSPLTQADLRAHAAIKKHLASTALPLLSEEGKAIPFEERSGWGRFWMVDPLDGTKEFIKRNGEFTVNIALIEGGRPVAGVIYAPVLKRLYYGQLGAGAFRSDGVEPTTPATQAMKMAVALPLPKPTTYTVVASRSHSSPENEAFIAQLRANYGELEFAEMGSSLKLCLVADGSAHIYPRLAPTMEWDTAAGHAIAAAAGKTVEDQSTGKEMKYNKPNLLNNWFIVK